MCSPTESSSLTLGVTKLYKAERFHQYDPKYVTELVFIEVQAEGCFLIDLYRTCNLWYHPLVAIRKSAGLRHLCVCFTFQTKKPRPPFIPCMFSAQSLHHSVRATHWSGAPVALCHAHQHPSLSSRHTPDTHFQFTFKLQMLPSPPFTRQSCCPASPRASATPPPPRHLPRGSRSLPRRFLWAAH